MKVIIGDIQSKFRVLDDWQVEYDTNSKYRGQCSRGVELKAATIYPKGGVDATDEEYVIHEILHIALAAINPESDGSRDREELFVRDVCRLLGSSPKGICVPNNGLPLVGTFSKEKR